MVQAGSSQVPHLSSNLSPPDAFPSHGDTGSLLPGPLASSLGCALIPTLRGMVERGVPQTALLELFEVSSGQMAEALDSFGLPAALDVCWKRGPAKTRWSIEHTRRFVALWVHAVRVAGIAEDQHRKSAAIYAKARQLGLPKRDRKSLTDQVPTLLLFPTASAPEADPLMVAAQHSPLLDWSDMVGVPEQVDVGLQSLDVMDLDTPEEAVVSVNGLTAIDEAEPEDVLGADIEESPSAGRRYSQSVPAECLGFTAPASRKGFDRWLTLMHPNIIGAIRTRLLSQGLHRNQLEDATHDVYAAFLDWHLGSSPKTPDVPRWTQYDPSRGIEFFKYITVQVAWKVQDYWKGHNRRRAAESVTDYYDTDKDFDDVVNADVVAAASFSRQSATADQVVDANSFRMLVHRISKHHKGTTQVRYRAAAAFETLLTGFMAHQDADEIRLQLSNRVVQGDVSIHNVKTWMGKLHAAAKTFQALGAAVTLEQFGVPA